MCTRFPAILDCSFSGGCESPILGKGRPYGVGMLPFERALVSSYAIHINFSSIFTRFRDIVAFVLQNATFSYLYTPQNFPMFPWE